MPVFLYNYSDRTMHGIYKAVSEGDLEINPRGGRCPVLCPDSVSCCFMLSSYSGNSFHTSHATHTMQDGPHSQTSGHSTQHKSVSRSTISAHHCQNGKLHLQNGLHKLTGQHHGSMPGQHARLPSAVNSHVIMQFNEELHTHAQHAKSVSCLHRVLCEWQHAQSALSCLEIVHLIQLYIGGQPPTCTRKRKKSVTPIGVINASCQM